MHPEPKTIYYYAALIHPPQVYSEKRVFDKINLRLSEMNMSYTDYRFRAEMGARFTGKVDNTTYHLVFQRDRIIVSEDWVTSDAAEFSDVVSRIAEMAAEELRIQFFINQIAVVRALFTPSNFPDSRVFLGDNLCGLKGKLSENFPSRPAATFGLRFSFPPTRDDPISFNVRMESYNRDPSQIFVEASSHPVPRGPIKPDEGDRIMENISRAERFIMEDLFQFLDQFDRKE